MEESGRRIYIAPVIESDPFLSSLLHVYKIVCNLFEMEEIEGIFVQSDFVRFFKRGWRHSEHERGTVNGAFCIRYSTDGSTVEDMRVVLSGINSGAAQLFPGVATAAKGK